MNPYRAAALSGVLAASLAGCGDFMATQDPGRRSFADVQVSLGAVGMPLGKIAAGKSDTLISLAALFLELSAPGLPTQTRSVALTGNINKTGITPSSQVFGLWGPRNWKVKAWTKDAADSVIHKDSTTLYVQPGDTASLSMPLNPRYSVLVGRFLSESNKVTSIEKLELRVNGAVVDDTTFKPKKKLFDVVLSNKYLRLGLPSTVEMRALDRAKPARVKYSKTVVIDPDESVESMITIQLD